jgi:hypothetical protein
MNGTAYDDFGIGDDREAARIVDIIFGLGGDSVTRLEVLLDELEALPVNHPDPLTFWRAFRTGWPSCDATWGYRDQLPAVLIDARFNGAPFTEAMCPEDAAWFASLPPRLKVYRGCSAERIAGLSWTVNRAVAESFTEGHRGIDVPNPVIVSATIRKNQVLFATNGREEAEVLIDPLDPLFGARRLTVQPARRAR